MKHPKSSDARYIGDYFISIANKGGGKVVMSAPHITRPHYPSCNTTACHGGWYAMGHTDSEFEHPPGFGSEPRDRFLVDKRLGLHVGYDDGAQLMAEKLGFSLTEYLLNWAEMNPTIWGNEYGRGMFVTDAAFAPWYENELTLRHIGKHWIGVADRLEELENK